VFFYCAFVGFVTFFVWTLVVSVLMYRVPPSERVTAVSAA
jgi:hypothetical protein